MIFYILFYFLVQKSGLSTTKTLVDYLKFDMNKCAIQTIIIPQYAQDKYLFESYKVRKIIGRS